MCIFLKKNSVLAMSQLLLLAVAIIVISSGPALSAALQDDEKFVEREFQSNSPGAHELATWLIAQLRQGNNQPVPVNAGSGCRYPSTAKRNSEIINSLLRLPQMDNGRK